MVAIFSRLLEKGALVIPARHVEPTGRMTQVMRAVAHPDATNAQKILRVGVVRAGRVVEERIVRAQRDVTVGASETSTFLVPGARREHALFGVRDGAYELRITREMSGRVALASGIHDLEALRRAMPPKGDVWIVPLSFDARGKIVIGETSLLFQFVVPPPPATKPQLPVAVRGGLSSQIDWTLTVIAAFSFMFHFGFIGAMYSDWLDEPVPDVGVAGLVDLTKNLPPAPPPVDVVDTAPTSTTPAPVASTPKDPTASPSSQTGTKANSEARAASLAAEGRAMGIELIGAFGAHSVLDGVIDRSNLPVTDLTGVATSSDGAKPASRELTLAQGGPVGPGHRSLQDLGTNTIGPQTVTTARVVDGPKGDVLPGTFEMSAPVANAERTIAKLRPGFRSCYQQKGLSMDSTMAGKLVMRIDIAPNGDVRSVTKTGGSGLSPAVEQCILDKVQNASFDAPGGGGSKLDVPVTFVNGSK